MSYSKKPSPRGFSLIEISIVMMIIGVLIAATISAKALIKNSRIAAAQAKTRSAPVNSIPNSVIWLESSLETSFAADEAEDGSDLSGWNDIKSGSAAPINNGSAGSTNPTYSNTINDIQAVKFSGNSNSYFEIDGSALNGSDYTIIILEKRQADGANYFLTDDGTSTDDNKRLQLGYSASGAVKHSQGSGNEYSASVGGYSGSGQNPRIFSFVQNHSTGKKIYVNGYLAAESSDTTQLSGIDTLHLGKSYTGEIGEFMIFDRALKKEERTAIETYLTEKWRMKAIATSNSNQDCTSGVIEDSGCAAACVVNIVGESTTSLLDGQSEDFDCDQVGYTDTISSQTCSGGTAITGTCGCDTSNNYQSSGGVCVQACSYNVVGASPATGTVFTGSASLTCDTTNNFTSSGFAYTCSGGSAISGNCACATGYYYDSSTQSCLAECSYDVAGATTPTGTVSSSSGTIACGTADNFKGTDYTYTCSGGATITDNCECADGYSYDSGTQTCVATPFDCTQTGTGNTKTYAGGYTIHTFISDGTLTCSGDLSNDVSYLVVAGGGSGGAGRTNNEWGGGGGGGGQVVEASSQTLDGGDVVNVTVGAGASVTPSSHTLGSHAGLRGESSELSGALTVTAYGGWGGARQDQPAPTGDNLSPGGGSSSRSSSETPLGNKPGGYGGATAVLCEKGSTCGGGSTANQGGNPPSWHTGGNGADGVIATIDGNTYGGGGGGAGSTSGGAGGAGGGGNGATTNSSGISVLPGDGSPNTGGGGGAGGGCYASGVDNPDCDGGLGGSGIVIIKYPTN